MGRRRIKGPASKTQAFKELVILMLESKSKVCNMRG
jgi:hypothetical protein